ncbi:hypothetical protein [Mucilaginibacter sp.]|uniref:hypothetical protein n=1 Tax=Mucilaginibacter sp. TaxID=1882438 RepID=UPI0025FF954A|nr:hypothetical protein [Mucilaginibacter sp.]
MKKYYLLIAVVFLVARVSQAQITLNLALNSRPQAHLSDWGNPVNGVMIISYSQGAIQIDPAIKLKTTLLDQNGSVVGVSNVGAERVYLLKPGVNQFSIADALQLQNLMLFGGAKIQLQRTGRLAAGQYQLMIEITNTAGDLVLTKQGKPFYVTSYQLPILMQPADGAGLDAHIAQSIITFRWTALVPHQEIQVYRVQVFEILPGQTPMQAFRGNRPLVDEEAIRGATQFIWHPNLAMVDTTANKKFIWTVQTFDSDGLPVPTEDANTQGRSEPAIFNIVNQQGTVDKNKNDQIKQ